MGYTIAIVGATGMVGGAFLKVLAERRLPADRYILFSSARSAGKKLMLLGQEYTVEELTEEAIPGRGIDIALFSAGASVSKKFAPLFAEAGAVVIDNSSAWRMDPDIPLVVPEVNPADILWHHGIIANPNCSTIQAVVALKPLHDAYGIKRVVYATYQAVSGAKTAGYQDLERGLKGEPPQSFPHPIAGNCLPHIDVFMENGYTKEEIKMIHETRKIMGLPGLPVTATCVRVPVFHSHSESINVEFDKPFDLAGLRDLLANAPGVIVQDDPAHDVYPMPLTAEDTDPVYVGRIRRDESVESGVNLWVVSDNVRKGAATNTVQIAQSLIQYWEDGTLTR